MPGPAPNPNARRRNNKGQWRSLPAEGRPGPPPPWPLGATKAKTLLDRWAELWSTPQAVAWEELGWTHVVARYCRMVLQAEKPSASVSLMAEVRQLEDRLGLNPAAMRKLYWVVDQPVASQSEPGTVTSLDEYRELYG